MTRYCEINGLDCGDVIEENGVSTEGGDLQAEMVSYPGRRWGMYLNRGRPPRVWKFRARFPTRVAMEEWIAEIRNAPAGSECFPFESSRGFYIAQADARVLKAECVSDPSTGDDVWLYRAEARIVAQEPWLLGPDKGLAIETAESLPWGLLDILTNEGYEPAGLDYLMASGNFSSPNYATDLTFSIVPDDDHTPTDRSIELCDKLMRRDQFEVDRFGFIEHEYETNFPMSYSQFQNDLHGSSFVNYGTGGSIAENAFVMAASAKLIMPFYGPLPICEPNPVFELDITSLTGTPDIKVAFETNLSDLAAIDHDALVVGENVIKIPDCIAEDFVAIGVTTGAGEGLTISRVRGAVSRYIPASQMPLTDPDETFHLQVNAGGSAALLGLICTYRDIYPI
ncbi:MAG: hypothetical protein A4E45_00060 [Methanosaeta sp. PtaB.Bin039]|nr:MAG: hypothetical protein A4E45_00060 [Methanosaeta sp. PtaB.Bin039]